MLHKCYVSTMEKINAHSLVLMVGPSGSGKSTFAVARFPNHEIVSSDNIRAELLGDFRNQSNQDEVWAEVHRRVRLRLQFGQRVVVDATNLRFKDRKHFIDMAKHYDVELIYLVVDRPLRDKLITAGWRQAVPHLIQKHHDTFQNNIKSIMSGDGVARVIIVDSNTTLLLVGEDPPNVDLKDVVVVGDVHGNLIELDQVIAEARLREKFILFLGDIVDYGDQNLEVVERIYALINSGRARMIWGNHERKLTRWIDAGFGRDYKGTVGHGLAKTVSEIYEALQGDRSFKDRFLGRWRCLHAHSAQHIVEDDWLFTHGAATPEMWKMEGHSLYGEHANMAYFGEVDPDKPARDDGYPNRTYRWVDSVPAGKTVVVGHDVRSKDEPLIVDNDSGGRVIFLDTGSSKGGHLSTLLLEDYV